MNFSSGSEVLHFLRQKKLSILCGGLIAVAIYVLFLFLHVKKYESNAIIYNSNKNKSDYIYLSKDNSLQDVGDSYTIINWVYSTELIDHLIKKFDLYSHYEIKPKELDSYSKCFNEISNNIAVNITSYGAVKISVTDKDRFFSADVTNEILSQVDKLNEQKVVANRKYIIREYEFLLKELSSDVSSQRDTIKKLLASLSEVPKTDKANYEKVLVILNTLTQASSNYEKLSNEWLTARKAHLLSLKDIEKFNLPTFVIVQYALPELPKSVFSMANLVLMLLVFISGAWLTAFIILLNFKYSAHVKFLLANSSQEDESKNTPKVYPLNDSNFVKQNKGKTEAENLKSLPNNN